MSKTEIPPWLSMLPEDVALDILHGRPVDHATAVAAWNALDELQQATLTKDLSIFAAGVSMGSVHMIAAFGAFFAQTSEFMQRSMYEVVAGMCRFGQLSPSYGRLVWQTGNDPLGNMLRQMDMNDNESK